MYNSINYLPPYLQEQPIFKDLCFFIDYLEVDIDEVYNDLRYKYIDWSKVSEEAIVQTLQGMGMDYIVDLINVITPSNSVQMLGLASLLWLLKGQLLGVDIIADICGFEYTYTVWHEQVPLGEPNTATMKINFTKYRELSEDFQYNFVEFLRKYLYPIISVEIDILPAKGIIFTFNYTLVEENSTSIEVKKPPTMIFDIFETMSEDNCDNCYIYYNDVKLNPSTYWKTLDDFWNTTGYYEEKGLWSPENTVTTGSYTSNVYDLRSGFECKVTPDLGIIDLGNNQKIDVYIKTSNDNSIWSDWTLVTSDYLELFRYFQVKAVFEAPEAEDMLLHTFKVTIS